MSDPVQNPNNAPDPSLNDSFKASYDAARNPKPTAPATVADTAPADGLGDRFKASYDAARNPKLAAPTTGDAAPKTGLLGAVSNLASTTGKAITDTATTGVNAVAGGIKDPKATGDDLMKKGKSFFENMDIGKIVGGLMGLGGAWFLGGFFGNGIMSTILMIALAFPLMVIGSDKLGGMINGWMGKKPAQPNQQPGLSPELAGPQSQVGQGLAQNQQVQPNVPTKPPVAVSLLTEAELNKILYETSLKGKQTTKVALVEEPNYEVKIEAGSTDPRAQVDVQKLRDIMHSGAIGAGQQGAVAFQTFDNMRGAVPQFVAVAATPNSNGRG